MFDSLVYSEITQIHTFQWIRPQWMGLCRYHFRPLHFSALLSIAFHQYLPFLRGLWHCLQPALGADGKKVESQSNVLLGLIENMQYAVTVDVLHTVRNNSHAHFCF